MQMVTFIRKHAYILNLHYIQVATHAVCRRHSGVNIQTATMYKLTARDHDRILSDKVHTP